jgi:hypothetical protein
MKIIYLLSTTVIISLFACHKHDDPDLGDPKETIVSIEGKSFLPTKSSVNNIGDGLVLTFKGETKSIIIKTNDNIVGTYNIISQSIKSASLLMANLTYKDGNNTYEGISGTITIIKNKGELISGIYNSKVVSDNGKIVNIDSGSFADIKTGATLISTESGINDTLLLCYSKLNEYVELSYIFDAVYANNISAPNSTWTEIYQHTQNEYPENEKIFSLWADAYEIIYKTNLIIESAEIIISDELIFNKIIGQAKAIRAYLFFNLMTWFGEIPIETATSESLIPRNTLVKVFTQIKEDATAAINSLPLEWSTVDNFRIPKSFMLGLLARINLTDLRPPYTSPPEDYPYNYNDVISSAQQIINSSIYALNNETNKFSVSDPEIIWGFEKNNNNEFNDIFTKGSYVPVLRLTEIYLIMAEALYQTGNTIDAISYINLLNFRRSNPIVVSITPDEIFQHWDTELDLEGSMFITLRRFNKALSVVQNDLVKFLLPVPYSVILKNPYLTQNIGY